MVRRTERRTEEAGNQTLASLRGYPLGYSGAVVSTEGASDCETGEEPLSSSPANQKGGWMRGVSDRSNR